MKEKNPEPEIDESLLTEGQKRELSKPTVSWKWFVFWGVLITLIIVCVIVVAVL